MARSQSMLVTLVPEAIVSVFEIIGKCTLAVRRPEFTSKSPRHVQHNNFDSCKGICPCKDICPCTATYVH